MNDPISTMKPAGRSYVNTGEGSVFFTAARVAEAAGRAQAKGDKRRCSRQSRVIVTAEECRERFLAGDRVCVNEFHGRCSTGALEASKEEKTMANYGKCTVCGYKGNRDKDDLCYRPECKKAREKVQGQPQKAGASTEAQECRPSENVQEQPEATIFGREGTPAVATKQGDSAAVFGQVDHVEEPRQMVTIGGVLNNAIPLSHNHSGEPTNMVPDLPEDLDRPFSLAGFDFDPSILDRPLSPPVVTIGKGGALNISRGAFVRFDLGRYVAVRMIPSTNQRAMALIFSGHTQKGYLALVLDKASKHGFKASAITVSRACPEIVGKRMVLQATGTPDVFVAVVDEEAA